MNDDEAKSKLTEREWEIYQLIRNASWEELQDVDGIEIIQKSIEKKLNQAVEIKEEELAQDENLEEKLADTPLSGIYSPKPFTKSDILPGDRVFYHVSKGIHRVRGVDHSDGRIKIEYFGKIKIVSRDKVSRVRPAKRSRHPRDQLPLTSSKIGGMQLPPWMQPRYRKKRGDGDSDE